jgi:hypothetical protein
VTKDYSEAGLVVDVTDLSFSEMLTLQNWLSFYEKNYIYWKGDWKVLWRGQAAHPGTDPGRSYDDQGLEANKQEQKDKQKFPPCNAE